MKKLFFFAAVAFTAAACSKDDFKTVPQIEINEFGPSEVIKGQLIQLRAIVKDKEGDIQDSLLVVRKLYNLSTNTVLGTPDTIRNNIRSLGAPFKEETEILVQFLYGELKPEIAPIEDLVPVDRGYTLGLVVKDRAGNRSEYVESERITLKKL